MLAPKRILHRKVQRGSMKGQAKAACSQHGSRGYLPSASSQQR